MGSVLLRLKLPRQHSWNVAYAWFAAGQEGSGLDGTARSLVGGALQGAAIPPSHAQRQEHCYKAGGAQPRGSDAGASCHMHGAPAPHVTMSHVW